MSDPFPTGQSFHDVVVVPYSDLLDRWRDGEIHRGGPVWPDWDAQLAARHGRGGRPVDVLPLEPDGPIAEARPMAWGGAIVDSFGHQVADFSARLLATRAMWPGLPIAFATRPDLGWTSLEAAPAYFRAILDWFGVPAEQVRVVTAPTRVGELFVAPQAEQLSGPGPDAAYLDALDAHTGQRLGAVPEPDDRLLYVSRAGMEARFAGERYLEAALERAGVRVVRPETMALADQLRTYRRASRLAFAEGSALHALQLSGRLDADVLVLQRRPGSRLAAENVQPRVRSLAYEETSTVLVHGLLPTGRMALPKGLSLAQPERFFDVFARSGVDLRPAWDAVAWATARDADVLAWVEAQASRPDELGPGSAELILDGLATAGLGHLADEASVRLEPLRERFAVTARVSPSGRPPLLFMHIPRTAGGAVRAAFETVIPANQRRDVYDDPAVHGAMTRAAFAQLPEQERAGLSLVVGDFSYGLHQHIPGPSRYATVLRHPVSRIISLYRCHARAAVARGATLPALESWVFDEGRIEADNAMVRAISGRPGVAFGACADDMLDEAVAHIEADFAAVLIRGNMSRSAVVLGAALGITLPPVPVVNADPDGEDAPEIDKSVRKRLRQLNQLDIELFRHYSDGF